jgi:hypothetical protein
MVSDRANSPLVKRGRPIHRRLLVVWQDIGDLAVCRSFLERSGCQVVACSSYEQVVHSLQSEAFDFVLLGSLLVALEWGRPAPAKVNVARAPIYKRRISHHLPGQARRVTARGQRKAPAAPASGEEIQIRGYAHED